MEADLPGRVIVGIDTTLSGLHALRVAVAQARALAAPLPAVRGLEPCPLPGAGGPTTATCPNPAAGAAA